ncbi:hypothetical protein HMPREF9075_01231 [Capnocytophaga sp. oral taxon 332 str. F0381]|nr:hypothetical protein HMPREF9075_01231 [Capnocytophaga sp. oral taxon 332 str. F0381]
MGRGNEKVKGYFLLQYTLWQGFGLCQSFFVAMGWGRACGTNGTCEIGGKIGVGCN